MVKKIRCALIGSGNIGTDPVSYTHLDVYKRQRCGCVLDQQLVPARPAHRLWRHQTIRHWPRRRRAFAGVLHRDAQCLRQTLKDRAMAFSNELISTCSLELYLSLIHI